MRCVECGHEIKDGAVFCIRCGAMQVSNNANTDATGRAVGAGATGTRNVKTFEPTPKRGGGGVVIFVLAAIAVLAAIVALAMFALNPGGSSGSASSSAAVVAASSSSSSASSASSSASSSSSSTSSKSASSASKSSTAKSSASAAASKTSATSAQNQTNQAPAQQQQQQTVEQQAPEPEPAPASTATDSSYTLSDSSTRLYSKAELQSMSADELWIARNEIFARHGRMFKDPDLQAYFNNKTWYTPIYTPEQWDATQSIADIESKNAALMLEVEQEKKSSHL